MKMLTHRGFTVVELLIVVVIIAILAIMTAGLYQNAQVQARDTQIRDAADKFADAILLWSAQNRNTMPAGGWGSTTAVTSTGCADGAGGFQGYQYGSLDTNYVCTLADAMVATGYLPANLFTDLPINPVPGQNTPAVDFITQKCSDNVTYLFYSQESPSDRESTELANLLAGTCSGAAANVNGLGMGGYIKLNIL